MEEEKSLVKVTKGKFHKIVEFISNIFCKKKKKYDSAVVANISTNVEDNNKSQTINDMDILEGILNKKIEIITIDDETKERLITLCAERVTKVKQELKDINEKIQKIDNFLKESSN